MSTVSYTGQRVRMAFNVNKVDNQLDVMTNGTPHIWRGTDVRFEVAAFFGDYSQDAELLDITNVSSLTLDVMPAARSGTLIMTKTVLAADMNTALTVDDFKNAVSQHAAFIFPATETAPTLGGSLYVDYFLVLSAITVDSPGKKITWGISSLRIEEDGHGNETTPEIGDPTYYTAAQVDAKIATPSVDVLYLYNQTTGKRCPVQIIGTGPTRTLAFGDTEID